MKSEVKSRFTFLIAGLTLLIIAGLSVCIIMLIVISTKGFSLEYVILFLSGLVLLGFGLVAIIKQSKAYTKNRVEEVMSGDEAFLTKWEIDSKQWAHFVHAKYQFEVKESLGYGWAAAGLMGLASGFVFWGKFDLVETVIYTLLIAGAFFFVGKQGAIVKARSEFKRCSQIEMSDVHFGKSSIIFNSKLILVDEFGHRLKHFSIQDRFNMKVIEFAVESGLGNRKSTRNYIIPVSEGKIEEAQKLSSYYNGIA